MKLWIKRLSPLIILLLCLLIAYWIRQNKTQARKAKPPVKKPTVEAMPLQPQDYSITLDSYGTVTPRTESTLVAQVSGVIVQTSSEFQNGGFFEEGDILLKIDPSDYQTNIKIAESSLLQARLTLEEENAKGVQALRDWQRLGRGGQPSDLVLRKPQLQAAQAAIDSAEARLEQAKRDLARTQIKAPYAGRILTKRVDRGQYVAPGTVLAEVYAIDYAEIRLPLSNPQLDFVKLPSLHRGATSSQNQPKVWITASIGSQEYEWEGRITRSEGAIDEKSRQWFVIAQVDNPYGLTPSEKPPLKIGQFVEASIEGKQLEGVFVIPSALVSLDQRTWVIENNQLAERQVQVAWQNKEVAVVTQGLAAGELLSLTPVSNALRGTELNVKIQE